MDKYSVVWEEPLPGFRITGKASKKAPPFLSSTTTTHKWTKFLNYISKFLQKQKRRRRGVEKWERGGGAPSTSKKQKGRWGAMEHGGGELNIA